MVLDGLRGPALVMPPWVFWLVLGLGLVVVCCLAVWIYRLRRRLRRVGDKRDAIAGGERRMFSYLHVLGMMIEEDCRPRKLYRIIVEGVVEVIGAEAGALYLLDEHGTSLTPSFLSEGCPPLGSVPDEVWEKGLKDRSALESHLRLARVPVEEGLLGACLEEEHGLHIRLLEEHEASLALPGGPRAEGAVVLAPFRYGGRPIGVLALTRGPGHRAFSRNEFELFLSVAEQSAFALGNALVHLEASEKRRMERQLRVAADVQKVLLPAAQPDFPGYRIHGMNLPAQMVSGDYYDYIPLASGELGVAIADVSGKGVSAGLIMASCRSALRAAAVSGASPAEVLGAVNRQMFPDMREDMFVSMAYLVLEEGSGRLRLARAGHDAPLMYRRGRGEVEVMRPGGLALGVDDGPVFERVTRDFEAEFGPGDCLLLYTDGVNEAENRKGEEFGKERLKEVFAEAAPRGAEAVVADLQGALGRFVGNSRQMDDITLIAIERR